MRLLAALGADVSALGSRRRTRRAPGVLLLILLASGLASVSASAAPPLYPPDFSVTAYAGAVSPAYSIRLVTIDPAGNGTFCRTDPIDRDTGACSLVSSFNLTVDDMNTLWNSIQSNGFSLLSPYYLDPGIADGTFAELTVTANSSTQQVITQNTAVTSFDAIMVTLNSLLPPSAVLKYNAIAP